MEMMRMVWMEIELGEGVTKVVMNGKQEVLMGVVVEWG